MHRATLGLLATGTAYEVWGAGPKTSVAPSGGAAMHRNQQRLMHAACITAALCPIAYETWALRGKANGAERLTYSRGTYRLCHADTPMGKALLRGAALGFAGWFSAHVETMS